MLDPATIELLNKISSISFAAFLLILLELGRRGTWVWGPHVTQMRADFEQRLKESEARTVEWKQLYLRTFEVAKRAVGPKKSEQQP